MNRHWNDEDFLNKLYEIGPGDNHLDHCASCRHRWDVWVAARRSVLDTPAAPPGPELFIRQQQRIAERLEARPSMRRSLKWSPAVAVAGMALFAVLWKGPYKAEMPKTDAQLMSEIYQTVSAFEPSAVDPIRGLFQNEPNGETPK